MKKEEIQQAIVEFQMVDQQIKVLHQQLNILEQQTTEISSVVENLESLKTVKPKTKAFAQIGPGISMETTLEKPNEVLMNIGANTLVKKSLPEAQEMLNEQIEEMKRITESMQTEVQKLMAHAQKLRQDIQNASQQ